MGNLRRATLWAARMGQVIAWLMILAGIAMTFGVSLPFFGTGVGSGLWLSFIGWFLNNASVQSYRQVFIEDVLEDVPVARMMRTNPPTCSADCSVGSLVHDHIMQSDDQAFPIVQDGQLVGLVTLGDVRDVSRNDWEVTSVSQIMTVVDDLHVVSPDQGAAEALGKLMAHDVRQLPVVRDGELVGLLRRRDIIKWLQRRSELNV
jgi:CBS domain-containing protein